MPPRAFGLRPGDRVLRVGRGRHASPKEKKLFGRALQAAGIYRTLSVDGLDRKAELGGQPR